MIVPIVLWFVVFVGVMALSSRIPGMERIPGQLTTTGGYLLALAVVLLVSARWFDRRPIRAFGFDLDRRWWLDLLGGLGIGVLTQGLLDGVYLAIGWARVVDVVSPGSGSFASGIALTLVLLVGVGIWEETLFRGVFLRNAVEGLGRRVNSPVRAVGLAWVVSAVVFGGLHLGAAGNFGGTAVVVTVVSTLISGLYFGLAYVLTGSLAFPIGLHVSTNFAAVSLFGLAGPAGREFPTLVRFERQFSGIWVPLDGLNLLYATSLLAVVVGWVFLTRGRVSIHDSLLAAAEDGAAPDASGSPPTTTTDVESPPADA